MNIYKSYPAWHNGFWTTVQDLNVNILDLGLIHSDATYDVLAYINGRGFKTEQHIDRFLTSCQYWRLPINYSRQELIDLVNEVHIRTDRPSSIIWISATRGTPQSGNPRDLQTCTTQLMCYAKPYQPFNGTGEATVCLASQIRVPDIAINQNYKNFVWPDLTRAQWEAIDRGYDTSILLSTDGYLTEGPGFNVAIIRDGNVYAPKSNRLPGISMLFLNELCEEAGISFTFSNIDRAALLSCDDMMLTTTIGNLVTVTKFENRYLSRSRVQDTVLKLLKEKLS
jgi:branched-chain amino acid aminotransferase